MTVKELWEILHAYPQDAEIVLASDAEGNSYSPLAEHDAGYYRPANTWSGEVTAKKVKGSKEVLVLWPVN